MNISNVSLPYKIKRQHVPSFCLGVDAHNFDVAARIFGSKGDYSALSLAVDDTALAPKIRSGWLPIEEKWSLMGHVSPEGVSGQNLEFDSEEDLRAALKDNNLVRGKKVRFFPQEGGRRAERDKHTYQYICTTISCLDKGILTH